MGKTHEVPHIEGIDFRYSEHILPLARLVGELQEKLSHAEYQNITGTTKQFPCLAIACDNTRHYLLAQYDPEKKTESKKIQIYVDNPQENPQGTLITDFELPDHSNAVVNNTIAQFENAVQIPVVTIERMREEIHRGKIINTYELPEDHPGVRYFSTLDIRFLRK